MPIISSPEEFSNTLFDYVVVGGGLTGLVVATRLSEDPDVTVGVLEAGPQPTDNDPIIDVPAMIGRAVGDPNYDWVTMSTPQPKANDRPLLIARGKGIGGSSMINYLYMIRPTKEEFDRIEELGNKGWNWESILHYMKKSENLNPTPLSLEAQQKYAINTNHEVHGTTGPLQKTLGVVFSDFHADVVESATHLGVEKNLDANAGDLAGISTGFASIDPETAKRSSAYSAYYLPNAHRKNLVILPNAMAYKVLISDDSTSGLKRATGVEFSHSGAVRVVQARREVVLSAGALASSRLLELSGIGNSVILSRLGIPVHVDLPGVGENLQDHIMVFAIAETEKYETLDMLVDPEVLKLHQGLYAEKKGLLAAVPAPAYVYVPANRLGGEADVSKWFGQLNEPEKMVYPETPDSVKKGITKQYEVLRRVWKEERTVQGELAMLTGHLPTPLHTSLTGRRYLTTAAFLAQPLSRGYVHITSSDPTAKPEVDPRYLSVESDFEMLVGLFKLATKLYTFPPISKHIKEMVIPQLPEEEGKVDEAYREYVRNACLSGIHPIGSAPMMPKELGGVVDERLVVYGTSNLRVADLSILPIQLSTHPQTTAYAIGEKAADMIKEAQS
ncbi:alcohol oxidase [Marasmius fiardii PR-910]|nr:alcohol oxidase [Marasmius fiardii PR-910]